MGAIASQITSLTIVYSIVYSDADQRKHKSAAPLAFVWGIHRGLVNFPHKWPVTRKMFPFDDVIMTRPWMTMIIARIFIKCERPWAVPKLKICRLFMHIIAWDRTDILNIFIGREIWCHLCHTIIVMVACWWWSQEISSKNKMWRNIKKSITYACIFIPFFLRAWLNTGHLFSV